LLYEFSATRRAEGRCRGTDKLKRAKVPDELIGMFVSLTSHDRDSVTALILLLDGGGSVH
jgi:hypothetical protein